MAGLFDTLSLGSRSLSTYRKAIDTTGHNLANVNTPGYTRQRLVVQSVTGSSDLGEVGMGAEATRIVRLHNDYFDKQIQVESSVQGSLEAREDALEQALTSLQETIDRNGVSGTTTGGISQGLAEFFASLDSLSTSPAASEQRLALLGKAQQLATKFNQVDSRLGALEASLNTRVDKEVSQVNGLLGEIANLNAAIVSEESLSGGYANDLRDSRELKLEELAKFIKVDGTEQPNGAINIDIAGTTLVDGNTVPNQLEAFDPGSGALEIRVAGQATALTPTGGSIEGTISTRDNDISAVREQVNSLAEALITKVNELHATGFGLTGSTGANFFTGTNASDIQVNAAIRENPDLLQASSVADAAGDNGIALALAQLRTTAQAALNGQTFSQRQGQIVGGLGQKLAAAKGDLEDQKAISQFVKGQRESVSGVSLDEEMTNLVMFQKAFQASAKLISMTDEMLETIIAM